MLFYRISVNGRQSGPSLPSDTGARRERLVPLDSDRGPPLRQLGIMSDFAWFPERCVSRVRRDALAHPPVRDLLRWVVEAAWTHV